MPRPQKIVPASGRYTFGGGLNNKFAKALILENESPDCLNVSFNDDAVQSREGVTKLNATSVGSFACDGLYTRKTNLQSETMVAWFGGTLWQLATTTFSTIGSAQSVMTAGVRVASAQYENHAFFGNGGVIPYKYNGTDFTRHGVYPPTTTSTVASQAVGALTGDYRYKVTWVNSQVVEGDVGPSTSTFTAAGATLRVSALPVAPQSYGVSARNLYRTVAGGSSYKFVATINDNTTTTYDDNIADGSLGSVAPTDNGVPPNYKAITYHADRLFMITGTDNKVWYTDHAEPYTVASTNFKRIGDNAFDIPQVLDVHENSIFVGCLRSLWLIYITDPSDASTWELIRISSEYGTKSTFGTFRFKNKLMVPVKMGDKFAGFAAISGAGVEQNATLLNFSAAGSDLMSTPIEPDMFQVANEGDISSIVYKNRAYITLAYGSGSTNNNRVYLFDFSVNNLSKKQEFAWSPWTGITASQFTIYNERIYYGSDLTDGFVHQAESGVYNDNGSAINAYFWTKEFGGDKADYNFHKDFRFANVLISKLGNYSMDFFYRVDSEAGNGNKVVISLTPGGSLWGSMIWGIDDWGGGVDEDDLKQFLGQASGKRIQFKFTNQNTVNQRFKVIGLNFAYNKKGFR